MRKTAIYLWVLGALVAAAVVIMAVAYWPGGSYSPVGPPPNPTPYTPPGPHGGGGGKPNPTPYTPVGPVAPVTPAMKAMKAMRAASYPAVWEDLATQRRPRWQEHHGWEDMPLRLRRGWGGRGGRAWAPPIVVHEDLGDCEWRCAVNCMGGDDTVRTPVRKRKAPSSPKRKSTKPIKHAPVSLALPLSLPLSAPSSRKASPSRKSPSPARKSPSVSSSPSSTEEYRSRKRVADTAKALSTACATHMRAFKCAPGIDADACERFVDGVREAYYYFIQSPELNYGITGQRATQNTTALHALVLQAYILNDPACRAHGAVTLYRGVHENLVTAAPYTPSCRSETVPFSSATYDPEIALGFAVHNSGEINRHRVLLVLHCAARMPFLCMDAEVARDHFRPQAEVLLPMGCTFVRRAGKKEVRVFADTVMNATTHPELQERHPEGVAVEVVHLDVSYEEPAVSFLDCKAAPRSAWKQWYAALLENPFPFFRRGLAEGEELVRGAGLNV